MAASVMKMLLVHKKRKLALAFMAFLLSILLIQDSVKAAGTENALDLENDKRSIQNNYYSYQLLNKQPSTSNNDNNGTTETTNSVVFKFPTDDDENVESKETDPKDLQIKQYIRNQLTHRQNRQLLQQQPQSQQPKSGSSDVHSIINSIINLLGGKIKQQQQQPQPIVADSSTKYQQHQQQQQQQHQTYDLFRVQQQQLLHKPSRINNRGPDTLLVPTTTVQQQQQGFLLPQNAVKQQQQQVPVVFEMIPLENLTTQNLTKFYPPFSLDNVQQQQQNDQVDNNHFQLQQHNQKQPLAPYQQGVPLPEQIVPAMAIPSGSGNNGYQPATIVMHHDHDPSISTVVQQNPVPSQSPSSPPVTTMIATTEPRLPSVQIAIDIIETTTMPSLQTSPSQQPITTPLLQPSQESIATTALTTPFLLQQSQETTTGVTSTVSPFVVSTPATTTMTTKATMQQHFRPGLVLSDEQQQQQTPASVGVGSVEIIVDPNGHQSHYNSNRNNTTSLLNNDSIEIVVKASTTINNNNNNVVQPQLSKLPQHDNNADGFHVNGGSGSEIVTSPSNGSHSQYVQINGQRKYFHINTNNRNVVGVGSVEAVIEDIQSSAEVTRRPTTFMTSSASSSNNNTTTTTTTTWQRHRPPTTSTSILPTISTRPATPTYPIPVPAGAGVTISTTKRPNIIRRPNHQQQQHNHQQLLRIDTCVLNDDSSCNRPNERCVLDNAAGSGSDESSTSDGLVISGSTNAVASSQNLLTAICICQIGYARRRFNENCEAIWNFQVQFTFSRYKREIFKSHSIEQQKEWELEVIKELSVKLKQAEKFNNQVAMGIFQLKFIKFDFNNNLLHAHFNIYVSKDKAPANLGGGEYLTQELTRVLLGAQSSASNTAKSFGNFTLASFQSSNERTWLKLIDVNECNTNSTNSCNPTNSYCANTFGSFECNCQQGYQLVNGKCVVNSCSSKVHCSGRGTCYVDGATDTKKCSCQPNYYGQNCELDAEILIVTITTSVIAVIIIVLTLCCLCWWSRHWKRQQASAAGILMSANNKSMTNLYAATAPGIMLQQQQPLYDLSSRSEYGRIGPHWNPNFVATQATNSIYMPASSLYFDPSNNPGPGHNSIPHYPVFGSYYGNNCNEMSAGMSSLDLLFDQQPPTSSANSNEKGTFLTQFYAN